MAVILALWGVLLLLAERLSAFLETLDHLALDDKVSNGPEVLDLCSLYPPDVMLLDFAIAGLDDVTLIRRVRQLDRQIQMIGLASSAQDNQQMQAGLEAGAAIVLQKDILASKLIEAIETTYASRTNPPGRGSDPQVQDS